MRKGMGIEAADARVLWFASGLCACNWKLVEFLKKDLQEGEYAKKHCGKREFRHIVFGLLWLRNYWSCLREKSSAKSTIKSSLRKYF